MDMTHDSDFDYKTDVTFPVGLSLILTDKVISSLVLIFLLELPSLPSKRINAQWNWPLVKPDFFSKPGPNVKVQSM